MKFITAFVLALCLLSPAAQAETTLFGLTLGKSTLEEVQKTYALLCFCKQYRNQRALYHGSAHSCSSSFQSADDLCITSQGTNCLL